MDFPFPLLNLPPCKLEIYRDEQKPDLLWVWDIIRKKNIQLTDEEWVRQHWIHYLINEKKCPKDLIGVEKEILFNDKIKKRVDVVVFNSSGSPLLLTECKKASHPVNTPDVLGQVAVYYSELRCKMICITNGLELINIMRTKEDNSFVHGNNDWCFSDLIAE